METQKRLLTTEQVARILNVEVVTVRRLAQRGELAAYRVGGEYRFSEADVEGYLEKQYLPARNDFVELSGAEFEKLIRERWNQFTQRAKHALVYGGEEARRYNHAFMEAEHLLVGLVRETEGVSGKVLKDFGLTLEYARQAAQTVTQGGLRKDEAMLYIGESVVEAVERAAKEAQQMGHDTIGTEHLLLGILYDENIEAILMAVNAETETLREAVIRMVTNGHP